MNYKEKNTTFQIVFKKKTTSLLEKTAFNTMYQDDFNKIYQKCIYINKTYINKSIR